MARKKGETFTCHGCGTLQAMQPGTYQAVSCIVCGHKHALVKNKQGDAEIASYFHQERPVSKKAE